MKLSTLSRTKVCVAISVAFCTLPAFAQVEAKLTGRVHYDFRTINNGLPGVSDKDSSSVADNFEMRRARIGFVGSINKDLQFEGVANAVGSSTNFIDTAFINYGYKKEGQVRVGRFKQPYSLEEITSSNSTDFMERSYVNQLAPQKKLGAMLHGATDNGITYGISVYQNDFNELTNANPAGTMGAARVTANLAKLAEMDGENTVVHLGFGGVKGTYEQTAASSADTGRGGQDTTSRSTIVAFRDENRGLNNAYRLQIRGDAYPNTFPFGTVADNTVRIDQNMASFELAVAHGPFKFQSEFANSKFDAKSNPYDLTQRNGLLPLGNATVTATAKASYISFIWNITGEDFAKSYSKGAWTNIKPKEDFMKDYGGVVGNGMGAWQLAYRISQYSVTTSNDVGARDATSATDPTRQRVNDGIGTTAASNSRLQNSPTATTQTVGLNWIMSQNARVMFNYSDTKFGNTVEYLDTASNNKTTTSEQIFSVRTQINF